ncbi:MAG TPA: aminotransferase class III-fold pyridoxal phosphate-dependent enzyme, partial [Streptosporangiaceae bacterium]|nr:aminotransferase class III-fold pyridoxal phosphate-dependent enzyme [Streptosporangiaceae bacterium]
MTIQDAERVAASFGLTVRAQPLGSQQDSNFLLADGGSVLGVLKIANPAFSAAEIEAQDGAAAHIARACGNLRVATATHGPVTVPVGGGVALARVLRYLPGGTLAGAGRYLSPRVVAGLGTVAGQVSLALSTFDHPGLDRVLQWDLRHAPRVVDALAGHVRDEGLRARVRAAALAAWSRVEPLAGRLPWQAVHSDVTDDNVVCRVERGLRTPDGIIDFGDSTTSWAVGELAVAITSVLRHAGAEPCSVLPAVRAFSELRPLSAEEAAVLWPLVVMRAAVLVVSGEQQAAIDGVNDYVIGALEHERRLFERAMSVPAEVMTALILSELGLSELGLGGGPLPSPSGSVLDLGSLDLRRCAVLDLSVQSDAVDEGAWLEPGLEDRLAQALLADGYDAVATRFGEARLTASTVLAGVSPATVATGIDLWLAEPLRPAELPAQLTMSGDGTRVHVSLRAEGAPEVPPLVRPEYAAGWLSLVADPGPLLGLPAASRSAEGDLLKRRDASFAAVQEHYYRDPPRIERGWRHHLAATDGRVYLDMVNNVTVLGHAHPRVEAAAARQLRRLNTNSRFNYASVVEFSERLAGLLPAPLDTVFMVNSGSEAVDLALRLALVSTGHQDVVAVREA